MAEPDQIDISIGKTSNMCEPRSKKMPSDFELSDLARSLCQFGGESRLDLSQVFWQIKLFWLPTFYFGVQSLDTLLDFSDTIVRKVKRYWGCYACAMKVSLQSSKKVHPGILWNSEPEYTLKILCTRSNIAQPFLISEYSHEKSLSEKLTGLKAVDHTGQKMGTLQLACRSIADHLVASCR